MTVPDEAIEAAAKAMHPMAWDVNALPFVAHGETIADGRARVQRLALESARAALEAAAPHLRAQALEDAAASIDNGGNISRWLRARAAAERGGE